MIIDTHCHYNIPPLWDPDQPTAWKQHWHAAVNKGVCAAVVVGVNAETSHTAVSIAETDTRLLAAVGFHPTDDLPESLEALTAEYTQDTLRTIETTVRALCTTKPVAAIGETGLDYFRLPANTEQAAIQIAHQKASCALQLRLATEFELPIILHVRDAPERATAYTDMLDLLQAHATFAQPVILHCVSGPFSYIEAAIKLGAYIGVAGNVTYKSAQHIRDIVAAVPKDRVLLETDAPFLAPQSQRGKPCEPWMIAETGEYLATELAIHPDQIIENTLRIFPQLAPAASQVRT